jgi:hypothetical protein
MTDSISQKAARRMAPHIQIKNQIHQKRISPVEPGEHNE